MKLLLINSVCGIGSTGRICADIANDYIEKGWDVKIAYGRDGCPEKYKDISYRIGSKLSNYKNAFLSRLFDNEGFNSRYETKKFIEWAEKYNPDVLWLHNLHGYYLNVSVLFDWIKSRPGMEVKWTLHDCWSFTGHCSYFTMACCDKWKNGCFCCAQNNRYPKSFIDQSKKNYLKKKSIFTDVTNLTLITPSKWLARLTRDSFLKHYPVKVVNNTIDCNIFKPTPSDFREKNGLECKKIILGVAGQWDKRKGFDDFVSLSKMICEDMVIVLVGSIKNDMLRNLPKNIIYYGKTNNAKELACIYTAADVFLNLTYEDNFPTTNLEAQACGTPCLTYNTGGSIESVESENIVEQADLNELFRKIKNIIK